MKRYVISYWTNKAKVASYVSFGIKMALTNQKVWT